MGRDRTHIILGWQGADSPLPTPPGHGVGQQRGWQGLGFPVGCGNVPLDCGSKLGAAGSTAGRGDAVPLHPAGKGTCPLAPCPISAFHTTKHQLPFCQASLRFPATPRAQQRTKNHQAHFLQTLCFSRGSHHPPRCRLSLSLPILPASHGCVRSLPNNIPPALQNPALVHPACIHPALEGSRC